MIKLFAFDLGNVIVPFDTTPVSRKLHERSDKRDSVTPQEIHHYIFDHQEGAINPYEEGLCSSLEFFLDLKERYNLDVEYHEFQDIWNFIFRPNPAVDNIIRHLKSRDFPLFLLSNTNKLHFAHIIEHYPIVRLLDEWVLSFEVGAKKPKKQMYEAIFEKTDVNPDEIFYIDDIEEYVNTARTMGIQGHVFKKPSDLWQVLRDNGI